MIAKLNRLSTALAVLVLGALPAVADTIYLTDGSTLDDVRIIDETLLQVVYSEKNKSAEKTVDPDTVLRIDYRRMPQLLDEGNTYISEGDIASGLENYEEWLEGVLSGENRKDRQAWAPAYAMRRIMGIYMTVGDLQGVVTAANKLISERPDSRHVPGAYLAKSEALRLLGQEDKARKAISDFRDVIDRKSLSDLWRLEAELAEILNDGNLKGTARRDKLITVATTAGAKYPVVRNRARVAEGESYISGNSKEYGKAQAVFQEIADDPTADDATLAGAYTGLGDCLFQQAAEKVNAGEDAAEDLRGALLNYLRVVVVYEDQTRHVSKSMFFAGRVFDLMDAETARADARRMYQALMARYPASEWAQMASR